MGQQIISTGCEHVIGVERVPKAWNREGWSKVRH